MWIRLYHTWKYIENHCVNIVCVFTKAQTLPLQCVLRGHVCTAVPRLYICLCAPEFASCKETQRTHELLDQSSHKGWKGVEEVSN